MATARPVTRISGAVPMSTVRTLGRPMSSPWWIVIVAGGSIELQLAQVRAEGGGRRARGRVLDDAADRERVARAERVRALAVNEVDRRQLVGEHRPLERSKS